VKGYLSLLMKNGLIERDSSSPRLYRSTSKGLEMMNRIKELRREMEWLVF
jgi:predicted transcriptional regulator